MTWAYGRGMRPQYGHASGSRANWYTPPTKEKPLNFNHHEQDDDDEPTDRLTCNRCQATGLHWQEIIKGDGTPSHALFNERNRKHVCAGPNTEGFEAV